MHIFCRNRCKDCSEEILDKWVHKMGNISSVEYWQSPRARAVLSVQAHPGLPFHLQLPWKKGISSSQVSLTRAAPGLPDTCSSCPDPCTAAQRGFKGPVQLQQVWLQQHGDARALVMLNYVTSQEEERITSCWVLWRCVQQQYWKSHGSKLSLLQLHQLEENKVLNCINEYSVTRTKKLIIC